MSHHDSDGRIEALCLSAAKGQRKTPVAQARLIAGHGLEGDAHAGAWHRQVSVLAAEDIATMRTQGLPQLADGDFAENLVVSGLDLAHLGLGSRLQLGPEAVLEITQLGKVCHHPCAIARQTGDCIMPRRGLFARVQVGGLVEPGQRVQVLDCVARSRVQAVVLTISDRCAAGQATDTAGPAVVERLAAALDAHIYTTRILPDEQATIEQALRHYADGHSIDLVVAVGGTGLSPRDVTPEAVRAVVERLTPGLDEAMRAASLRLTPHAMLSRAVSGIRAATLILSLPGSQRAAVENLAVILPALAHGLAKLGGDASDCGQNTDHGQ